MKKPPKKPAAAKPASRKGKARPAAAKAAAPAKSSPRPLHVLSDSTGNLARHMLAAFLTQFPRDTFVIRYHNFLHSSAAIAAAMQQALADRGIVVHAVVSRTDKLQVHSIADAARLPCCDLTGTFVDFLAGASGVKPLEQVDRLHHLDANYLNRIAALEFTLEHDDGLGLDTIWQADVVLAGVSRTGKTPTSIFLAQMGYRVANVSLAMGVDPPPQLMSVSPDRVVGLIVDPLRLSEIRASRHDAWGMGHNSYDQTSAVEQEVAWCRKLFRQHNWPIIDVTRRAIEETAGRITEIIQRPGNGEKPSTDQVKPLAR